MIFNNVQIVRTNPYHLKHIKKIVKERLGLRVSSYCTVDGTLSEGNISFTALVNDKVVGWAVADIYVTTCFLNLFNKIKTFCYKAISKHEYIGYLRTIVVSEKYENQRIGTKLWEKRIAELNKFNLPIITVAWKPFNKDIANVKRLSEIFNFNELVEIAGYWSDISLKENIKCISCGNPPCRCSAVVYYRDKVRK